MSKSCSIKALVLHKKDISFKQRRILLCSAELPFIYATAFATGCSVRTSSLTNPFTLSQFTVTQNSYGWQIQDAYGLEFYTKINENWDYFIMVHNWVKILMHTYGAGEDNRLFFLLYALMQQTQQSWDWRALDTLFYTKFLHLLGQWPTQFNTPILCELRKNPIVVSLSAGYPWEQIQPTMSQYFKHYIY